MKRRTLNLGFCAATSTIARGPFPEAHENNAVGIPDVTGLSALNAALAYADAGLFVLPVATGKHPGSVVGRDWPNLSTRDPELIEAYWDRTNAPGIAIHLGRSQLVAVDLDIDAIPDEMAWLRKGLFQSSRGGRGERGHYVFATAETFRNVDVKLCDGNKVGDIKTGNAVIMAEPSAHPKVDDGGAYIWQTTGEVPDLPAEGCTALAVLSTRAGGADDRPLPVSDEAVTSWCERHTEERDPWRRKTLRDNYAKRVERGESRHDAMMAVLGWAAREVAPGLIAATVFNDLHADWNASYRATGSAPKRGDFAAMLRTAIGAVAPADDDPGQMADLVNRGRRDFGTDHRDNTRAARALDGWLSGLDNDDTDSPQTAGQTQIRRNAPVDLRRLRTEPAKPVQWLLPDVLARDSYISLSAAPGTGKSVLARGIAVDASLGQIHTDHTSTDRPERFNPARVIYLDAENGEDWWRDGLNAMNAPLDLPNLAVVCYPDLAGLDTANGAREFLQLVSELSKNLGGCDLVVFDTVSRFIAGGENDADTWSQFYRNAIQPLRDQKIAILRLDHLGKNADLGPRGSSHKLSDVDADFRLTTPTPGSNDLALTLGKRRRPHFAETVRLRRIDNPLRHEHRSLAAGLTTQRSDGTVAAVDQQVAGLVDDLDSLGVDPTLGRAAAQKAYGAAGGTLTGSNQRWNAAVKVRKSNAQAQAGNGGQSS
ncbi:AAA family ATPase [Mycobacterium sp. SMC-4]|uniref:AAA family ATPase n=1 Tax=Mycobacterium sp. SMC-4 TaxID=2857059 RepID=UPI003D02C194